MLREGEDRGDGRGRRYSTVAQRGKRVHLKYGRGSRSDTGTVAQVVGGMLRTAERDFAKALRSGTASGAGELRDLWASRLKGWVNDAELREINRMLVRLAELLQQPRDPRRSRLVTLAWMLAPIDGKPLRRAAPRRGARKARPAGNRSPSAWRTGYTTTRRRMIGAQEDHRMARAKPAWTPVTQNEAETQSERCCAGPAKIRRARACSTRPGAGSTRIATGFPGMAIDPTDYLRRTFEEVAGYDEMIVLRDIEFESFCEHHMAPIIGRAHVGYLPTDRSSASASSRASSTPTRAASRCRRS